MRTDKNANSVTGEYARAMGKYREKMESLRAIRGKRRSHGFSYVENDKNTPTKTVKTTMRRPKPIVGRMVACESNF